MYFLLLSCLAASSLAASPDMQLPSYLKACKKKDFDACVIRGGGTAISSLWKGDQKFKIPLLDPYKVVKVEITESGSRNIALNLTFVDLNIYGLKGTKIVASKTDFKKNHVEWTFTMPKLRFVGKQRTSGKFLLLPIVGEGPCEIDLINVTASYKMDWTLESRKGKQWMKPKNGDFKYDLKGLKVNFQGLFNGDKALENNMNVFLNENWEELTKSVGPSFAKAMAIIVLQVIEGLTKIVPWNNLVL